MVNNTLISAFGDELEKIAGAKRYLRMLESYKKNPGKMSGAALERARKKYERRMARFGVDPSKRQAPKAGPVIAGSTAFGATAGGAVGGLPGAVIGGAAGNMLGVGAAGLRKGLYDRQGRLATSAYKRRIGVPDTASTASTARKAIQSGSPTDIPQELSSVRSLRRQRKTTKV